MSSLDFEYAPLAVWLCLGVFGFLVWRYPAGLVISGYVPIGLGWVSFGNVTFVRLVFFAQIAAFVYLSFRVLAIARWSRVASFLESRYSMLFWVLAVVLVKIGADIALGGIDEVRSGAISTFAYQVALPSAIFFLSVLIADSPRQVFTSVAMGLLLFSLAYLLPILPAIISEGRVQTALGSIDRLTSYAQDPINGGRFFFFGGLGALAIASVGLKRRWLLPVIWTGFCTFQLAALLNGSRQYILALAMSLILYSIYGVTKRWTLAIAFFLFIISGLWIGRDTIQLSAAVERLSSTELTHEVRDSRGAIWLDVIETTSENPLLGVGFCRYGQLVTTRGREGESVANLSGAHGFFQDIFAEHGALLGLASLAALVAQLRLVLLAALRSRGDEAVATVALIGMMAIPNLISGAVFNGLPLFLFAIAMIMFAPGAVKHAGRGPVRPSGRIFTA